MNRKTKKGDLDQCSICKKCQFTRLGSLYADPYILVTWKCDNCGSKFLEVFTGIKHRLIKNGRSGK